MAVFLDRIHESGFLQPGAVLFARPGAGRVVTLADNPYHDAAASLRELIRTESLRGEPSLGDPSRSDGSVRSDPARLRKNGMPHRNRATMHLRGAGGSDQFPSRRSGSDALSPAIQAERTSIFHGLPAWAKRLIVDSVDFV